MRRIQLLVGILTANFINARLLIKYIQCKYLYLKIKMRYQKFEFYRENRRY